MPKQSTRILAVVEDLFFVVKINDSAKRAGLVCEFLKSAEAVLEKAKAERPLMVIIDLNARSVNAVDLIGQLRREEELKGLSVIAFVSHVEGELKQRAQDAGAMVLARSAFSTTLPQILKRHSGSAV
jgi:CheY-like chemotaxis protein